MVDEEDFVGSVDFHFPAPRQVIVGIGEHVDEVNQITVVLVSFKTSRVTTNLVHLIKGGMKVGMKAGA